MLFIAREGKCSAKRREKFDCWACQHQFLVNNNHSKARCTQELLLLRLKSLLLLCVLAGWFLQERKEREANEQQQREAPRKIPRCVSCVTSISGRTTSKQSTTSAKRNMTSCLDRMTSSKQSTTSSKQSTLSDRVRRLLGPPSLYGAHTGPFSAGRCSTGMADGRRGTAECRWTRPVCWLRRWRVSDAVKWAQIGRSAVASIEQ